MPGNASQAENLRGHVWLLGESSRCAGNGRESRRESRHGVRRTAERVVGRVVTVCGERPRESSGESSRCAVDGRESRRESRHGGQMYGSASSRPRDRTQADGAVSHLELERSCGSIPAGLRGGCPISVDPVESGSPRRVGWVTAGNGQRRAKFGGRRTRSPPEQKLLPASLLVSLADENGEKREDLSYNRGGRQVGFLFAFPPSVLFPRRLIRRNSSGIRNECIGDAYSSKVPSERHRAFQAV